jgi:hydrogenase maturation protease
MTADVVLIGVGNRWRGDDGVGPAVVEAARQLIDDEVDIVECDGEPSRMIDLWSQRTMAIVVDATHGAGPIGAISVWDGDVPPLPGRETGSHSLGIGHAIALATALDRLPTRLVVIGIEAENTGHCNGLSAAVAASVQPTVQKVVDLARPPDSA